MEQYIENLTKALLEKNPAMPAGRARVWVELLWSDFEATSAKAGYEFRGPQYTEKLVSQLIASYGDKLHEFAGRNPKYVHLLDQSEDMMQ
ncbi:YfhJ family protein [Solibacillus sp. CAU 1738]|uniref:YfhJ family protein n=1 Tax=Solibacillus sp. CAU 1738 TaxID=3140363 RepID=UPI003260B7D8